jgi:23S rRNA (adenine2030-N6)-methyltransferase
MLSYRHAFHAGNHADVLKHVVWIALLADLTKKDKPLWVIDTHAGAGCYSLEDGLAAKNAEYETGIACLWSHAGLDPLLSRYVELVQALNPDGILRKYPGSPQIAWELMRDQDRLRLFERHTTDSKALQACFGHAGRRVSIVAGDGFAGLKAVLPPPSRRGLVLVDPSYEEKSDYFTVQAAMRDALQRFATGTYAVWYPQVQRRESSTLPSALRRIAQGDWLDVSLTVATPAPDGFGLHGSGMFVFNPPWQLELALGAALPPLVQLLGRDEHAHYALDFKQT